MNTTTNSHVRVPDGDVAPFTGLAVSWQKNTLNYRVKPNAVVRTLRKSEADRRRKGGQKLWPVLSEHSSALPFGWIASAQITDDGLYVTGYLDATTPECQKAFQDAKDGKVNGLSIGFKTIAEHREGDVRVLDEIELVEISVGADPVDVNARLYIRDFSESEYAVMRAIAQEKEYEMANHRWIDDDEFERPLYDHSPRQEPDDRGYRIEPGLDPMEDPKEFQKELRAQLRLEDPDLYTLTPGGRAFNAEIARRQAVREERQRLEREALAADRKAIADRQIDPMKDYTLTQLAAKSGLEIAWVTRLVQACVNGGEVEPAVAGTLILRGCDFMKIAKRHHQAFEAQFESAAFKRAARLAQEKRSA